MHPLKIDAIVASAWNVCVGTIVRGDNMTPTKAATLPSAERVRLIELYRDTESGGRLYSDADCAEAIRALRGSECAS